MFAETYKKELRKEKIKAREALTEDERLEYSAAICRRIRETAEYKAANNVFIYKWVRGEVKLDDLEEAAVNDGKTLLYPLCISKSGMLAIAPGEGGDAWKDSGFKGIREPAAEKGTVVDPSDIDLVIAPCSSFDEQCRRLGMGGGFYDRYLPGCSRAKIFAVAFEAQRADEIPTDEHDFPVDAVITEACMIIRPFTAKRGSSH